MRTLELAGYRIEITGKEDGDARDERHWTHAKYCMPRQAHGAQVCIIDDDVVGKTNQFCDALVGVSEYSYLGVYTGDCCPIAIMGEKGFAIIHGSWKTLYEGIIFRTMDELLALRELPQAMKVFFGPSIKKEVYEVGREFYNYFPKKFLQKIDGFLTLDMVEFAISQLEWKGVSRTNIVIDQYCTYQNNDLYFSHRMGESGRNFLGVSRK